MQVWGGGSTRGHVNLSACPLCNLTPCCSRNGPVSHVQRPGTPTRTPRRADLRPEAGLTRPFPRGVARGEGLRSTRGFFGVGLVCVCVPGDRLAPKATWPLSVAMSNPWSGAVCLGKRRSGELGHGSRGLSLDDGRSRHMAQRMGARWVRVEGEPGLQSVRRMVGPDRSGQVLSLAGCPRRHVRVGLRPDRCSLL